jgi:hypothetical protein
VNAKATIEGQVAAYSRPSILILGLHRDDHQRLNEAVWSWSPTPPIPSPYRHALAVMPMGPPSKRREGTARSFGWT